MKTYFKILAITAGLQLGGFGLTYLLDAYLAGGQTSTLAPLFVGGLFLLASTAVGIFLPIKWCHGFRQKLLTILLLPTNYTWLILAAAVVRFVLGLLEILEGISRNFG